MMKKTIIPRQKNMYSSFPTFTTYKDDMFLFYRQAEISRTFGHGLEGIVNCWKISKKELVHSFQSTEPIIYNNGTHATVFENRKENEIDSIVSKLDDNLYTLVTRMYLPKRINQPYISASTTPEFTERWPVKVEGTEWLVLYGKGLKTNHGYIFPAYGSLRKEPGERVIILQTDDFKSWSVLSTLPLDPKRYILNESTLVKNESGYTIYMRSNVQPFAIWAAHSYHLKEWTKPIKLVDYGHAPMAIRYHNQTYITYRDLSAKLHHATSLLINKKKKVLDEYVGSPYDGGYSDLGIVDGHLFVVYYTGNEKGEPYIKGSLLPLK